MYSSTQFFLTEGANPHRPSDTKKIHEKKQCDPFSSSFRLLSPTVPTVALRVARVTALTSKGRVCVVEATNAVHTERGVTPVRAYFGALHRMNGRDV